MSNWKLSLKVTLVPQRTVFISKNSEDFCLISRKSYSCSIIENLSFYDSNNEVIKNSFFSFIYIGGIIMKIEFLLHIWNCCFLSFSLCIRIFYVKFTTHWFVRRMFINYFKKFYRFRDRENIFCSFFPIVRCSF